MNDLKCTIDDCPKDATHTFVWPWGVPGACCDGHVVIVRQRAESTRGEMGMVSFSRLDPDRPREVTRDERTQLIAAKLSAEAETEETKLRAERLFSSNTELSKELRLLRVRVSQYEADAVALRAELEQAKKERDDAVVLAHDARVEAERFGVATSPGTPAALPPKLVANAKRLDPTVPELAPTSIGPVEDPPEHGIGG